MPDREIVLGHLDDCMEASKRDNTWVFVRKDIVEDALALLKEQEPKPVELHTNSYGTKFYFCPKCKRELFYTRNLNFCERCGQEVKWE